MEAAAQVRRTVFNAMMEADPDEWQHSRYLLNLNYDSQGRPTQPHAQPIALAIQKPLAGAFVQSSGLEGQNISRTSGA